MPFVTKPETVKIVSYEVLENGDTINKLDNKNIQHGKWIIDHEARYDEEATMEIGSFDKGIRIGQWRLYSKQGILIAEENYKRGLKDGEARYYDDGHLLCVGNYMALNAKQKYDTIMVENPETNVLTPTRIKTDVGSIRHGTWTYYEAPTKKINRVVEYQADEIVYDKSYTTMSKADSVFVLSKIKSFPHISNRRDENMWLDKTKRSNVKYTDIPDDKPVKPNVRKK